jgi:nucleotide-binding universal stress UspA family protein
MQWHPKKIVVPVDFSDDSIAAVETAVGVGGDAATVHVIHVLQDLSPIEPGEVWYTIDAETRKQRTTEALQRRLAAAKIAGVHLEVAIGDPGHKITEYSEDIDADLIVMPSHGRSGLRRLLIGSVAERVLRLSHCPVLILRD